MNLERLPIFPLPGVVLLPGSVIPLHVFEPRYRQLVADCRAGDGVLGLATLTVDPAPREPPALRPAVHPTLGVGQLVGHTPMADGRSLIAVQGVLRARIVDELDSGHPYRIVSVERLVDQPPSAPAAVRELATLRALTSRLARADEDGETAGKELAEWSARHSDVGRLADVVGGALVDAREERLALLDQLDPVGRMAMVNKQVAHLVAHLEGQGNRPAMSN